MTILCLFLLAMIVLVGCLLCLAYRETEQDFPPAHRYERHQSARTGVKPLTRFLVGKRA